MTGALWDAYGKLNKSLQKEARKERLLTDMVSIVRFAMHQENELVPFPERVQTNFSAWMAQQQSIPRPQGEGQGEGGAQRRGFTDEQIRWLEMIRDHIAANLSIEADDFDYAPFAQQGGLGKVHQVFGDELGKIIEELNGVLAA